MADNIRMENMLENYGELCNQQVAAHILGVSARTVNRMMKDGRMKRVGTHVEVRSICRYIDNPDQINREACYFNKRGRKPHYVL